ncbi:MAG: hypothetical protein KDC12_11335, partial [Flavobacteriales bacterium]|nr:hypothetical protein [Flavobacteriales bacterium]
MRTILSILVLFLSLGSYGQTAGCMDSSAANYNSTATEDNGNCAYLNLCGDALNSEGTGTDFTGPYSSENWVFMTENNGTATVTNTSITIVGSNIDGDIGENEITLTQVTTLVNVSGEFSFSWDYATADTDGPEYDIAYYINGIRYDLSDING